MLALLRPVVPVRSRTVDTVGVIVVVDGVTLKHEQALERAAAMNVSATASRATFESQTVASILAAGLGAGARF